MDAKTIGDIIAIISPLITLILTLIALLNNRIVENTSPIDTPSLKILRIKRNAPSSSDVTRRSLTRSKSGCAILLLPFWFFINTIIILNVEHTPYFIFVISLYIVSTAFLVALLLNLYTRSDNLVLLNYTYYDNAEIIIEADKRYLFDKCIGALKRMKLNIVEVELGDTESSIKALQVNLFASTRSINVMMQKIENSESAYSITFELFRKSGTPETDISLKSKITNNFIDSLISKPSAKAVENKQS